METFEPVTAKPPASPTRRPKTTEMYAVCRSVLVRVTVTVRGMGRVRVGAAVWVWVGL